ncbi:hypothetical protein [Parasphingorhabdus cellanae]|uniref:Uncharacterized protein n=1 Tax=Parasphingorhabdus cellanae TaxID=2806553 RepID=A0ABX7T0A7_9SPHN|nr:hypothetical protein [Parasphingorhabdus cellanae]QTD54983.1 hypothetical protein J4G78_12150 [Parasphingorhabdus cellanae]
MTAFNKKNHLRLSLFMGLSVAFGTAAQAATGYQPGHTALEVWNAEGQANAPQWVQIWLMIMLASFALGLLFVWNRVEARWVVGGFITAILISRFGIPAMGIVKLSGLVALVHLIFWSPALYLLLKNRPFLKERSLYALWTGLITAVILFSFIFDIRDAAIYLDHVIGTGMLST